MTEDFQLDVGNQRCAKPPHERKCHERKCDDRGQKESWKEGSEQSQARM